jgi:hypothetical protein
MYAVRLWSVRNAGRLERIYDAFAKMMLYAHPLLERIGYVRLDAPVAAVERRVKGMLFDCQMCGRCVLGATGMSCPMNCPKSLRNGPCGGVRPDGNCEVKPGMRCVWVEAWSGAQKMRGTPTIVDVQAPVDNRFAGTSAWLRATREAAAAHEKTAGAE